MKNFGALGQVRFIQRGWANANMVLIAGDNPALIDTGHFSYFDETVRLIEAQGVAVDALETVFLTHSHWDHSSGANLLRKASGARVGMGALTAQWMHDGAKREMWTSYFGVDAPLISADFTLTHNDQIKLGGLVWQAISLPGHAPDLIGLYQADSKVLISADSLLPIGDCGLINIAVHGWEALAAAEESAHKIAELDVDIVLPGHGPPIFDVAANIEKLLRRLQRFRADPTRLATHLARRTVMSVALELPPMSRQMLIKLAVSAEWAADYAPIAQLPIVNFIEQTVTALEKSGALREVDGNLVCQVAR